MMTNSGSDSCWYRYAENPDAIEQGQLLFGLTVGEVPDRTADVDAIGPAYIEERIGNFAVATQTCDAERLERVLLVSVGIVTEEKANKSFLTPIAKGYRPNYHLLPPEPRYGLETYLICNFADFVVVRRRELLAFLAASDKIEVGEGENARNVLTPEKTFLLDLPYREHFAVSLGAVFSRVALEQNAWERGDFPGHVKPEPLTG